MSGSLTIGRWIEDRARTTPDRVAIDFGGRAITYAQLDDWSSRVASALAARGLRRGDRVATLTGNSPEHVAVFFACAKSGLVLAPLSWRLAPPEVAYQHDDADPAVLLVEDEHAGLAEAAGREFEQLSIPERTRGARWQAAAGAAFDATGLLERIAAPTLILHGTLDAVIDPRNAEVIARRIPGSRVKLFEGCGHLLFWEQPERFVQVVEDFLA